MLDRIASEYIFNDAHEAEHAVLRAERLTADHHRNMICPRTLDTDVRCIVMLMIHDLTSIKMTVLYNGYVDGRSVLSAIRIRPNTHQEGAEWTLTVPRSRHPEGFQSPLLEYCSVLLIFL